MKLVNALVLVLLLVTSAAAEDVRLRVASSSPPEHPTSRALEVFKQELERRAGGAVTVEVLAGLQFGGVQDQLEQLRAGKLEAAALPTGLLAASAQKLGVLGLPFMFKDRETTFRVLDGPLGKELERELEKAGLVSLGFWEGGVRHVTNRKLAINRPEDLAGLRIRIPSNTIPLRTFKRLGARPVPLDVRELYSALERGSVDGQEGALCETVERKFHDVQAYLAMTGHIYDLVSLAVPKRVWDGLGRERQGFATEAARAATVFQRQHAAEQETRCLDVIKQKGLQVTTLTPEALAAFRAKVRPIYAESEPELGRDLMTRFADAAR